MIKRFFKFITAAIIIFIVLWVTVQVISIKDDHYMNYVFAAIGFMGLSGLGIFLYAFIWQDKSSK